MEKVMLYAYTAHNLGDDLFIYTICHHYPDTTFYLYAPRRYRKTFETLSNLHIIPSNSVVRRLRVKGMQQLRKTYRLEGRLAKQCDAGIYIGGSLFMEQENWREQLAYVHAMIKHHDKLFLIGANFGPYTSQAFLSLYQELFQQFTALSFRDTFSKNLFTHPQNQQAADVIFQLGTKQFPTQTTNTIVISVIYPAIRSNLIDMNHSYFHFIAQVAETLIKKGYRITLISFCEIEKDPIAVKEILSNIAGEYHSRITAYHYTTNIEEALHQIANAKAVIATRFHAMILGWLFHKPTYPIVYNQKMQHVINEYQFRGKYTTMEKLETMDMNDVLESIKSEVFPIENCIDSARKHFDIIDAHMKKE